jgi:hypothetical protein
MRQKLLQKKAQQGCRYTSFEPNHYVSSHLFDVLKSSFPRSPKCGVGSRPRSASSVQSCASRPRSAGSLQSSVQSGNRPRSAGSLQSSMQSGKRPNSASSVRSGNEAHKHNRPASASLGSLSKSLRRSSNFSVGPQPKRSPRGSKVVQSVAPMLPRPQTAPARHSEPHVHSSGNLTLDPEVEIKAAPPAAGSNRMCSGSQRFDEWRSLALPIWKKQRT